MNRNPDLMLDPSRVRAWRLIAGASAALGLLLASATAARAQVANTKVSRILGMFDIDGRGGPDLSGDTDGDGLPDSWEVGGFDPAGTDVPFPGPEAIVPGTPPSSIFARRPVRTSATSRDTDGDGLTDFIEVFGLKFIDDNGNGILDDASGGVTNGEWFDTNGDGMPSIGEFAARNELPIAPISADIDFDFDGFVFTDPTNPDTDGDGILDGADNDPLINPRSFGVASDFFPSGIGELASDDDLDNDGLGNGMDLGNDINELIDNPDDLRRVLDVFRPDLVEGVTEIRVPEGLIEDLLGADWNGDGLFRLTDVLRPVFGIDPADTPTFTAANIDLFRIENPDNQEATIPLGFVATAFPDRTAGLAPAQTFDRNTYYSFARRGAAGVNAPQPFQEFLIPAGRDDNVFLPDPRIWTVLYAWRVPGFDIDGNGFIGFDGASFRGNIELNGTKLGADERDLRTDVPVSEHRIPGRAAGGGTVAELDGAIDAGVCPLFGFSLVSLTLSGLLLSAGRRRDNHCKC